MLMRLNLDPISSELSKATKSHKWPSRLERLGCCLQEDRLWLLSCFQASTLRRTCAVHTCMQNPLYLSKDSFNYHVLSSLQLLIDSPVSPVTSILPLVFVITVTAIKQVCIISVFYNCATISELKGAIWFYITVCASWKYFSLNLSNLSFGIHVNLSHP